MLGKVFKYEMRANFRFLGPAGLACLLTLLSAFAGRGLANWMIAQPMDSQFHSFGIILSTLISMLGTVLFTIILYLFIGALAVRFYKAFSGAEAYTTFSLPVPISTQLKGHLLSGAVYSLVGSLLSCLCLLFFVIPMSMGSEVFLVSTPNYQLSYLLEEIPTGSIVLFALCLFALFFISAMAGLLQLWACIAIGGQFSSARIPMSVAAYFVLNFVETIISLVLGLAGFFIWVGSHGGFSGLQNYLNSLPYEAIWGTVQQWMLGIFGLVAAGMVLFGVIHVLLCRWLFTKRLNLA